jgi:hypothetical protein
MDPRPVAETGVEDPHAARETALDGCAAISSRAHIRLGPEKYRRLVVRWERLAVCSNVFLVMAIIHLWVQKLIVG